MKNKLLKNPQHVAQMGYNPFPLHMSVDRSDVPGMLTPCYSAWLQAGDKIDASVSIRTRTLPLMAPASAYLKQCVDWFFVPVNQLLQQFGNWLDNIRDEKSDFYGNLTYSNSPQNLPSFSPFDILAMLDNDWSLSDGHQLAAQDMLRLCDCLGMSVSTMIRDWNSAEGYQTAPATATTRLNVFFPAAYQKIYFDYYRLSDREKNDPEYYNFDTYMASSNSPTAVNGISNNRLYKLLTMHYAPYRKDYFTNLFISPVQGQQDLSSYGINPASVNQWLTGLSLLQTVVPNTASLMPSGGSTTFSASNPTTVSLRHTFNANTNASQSNLNDAVRAFNPPNVSTMFAVQKMLEISRRAGKHFDAQTLAHFGINVPVGISGEVMHLGHYEQPFIIGDVISTAETADGSLGEMAGKGYASGSMKYPVKFTAPYHGVLMAIHYIIPDQVVYGQYGFQKEQTYITPSDWPRPEFDSLGMQPLFGYETNPYGVSQSAVLGWQYRYQELKMKYNVAYGNVHPEGSLHYWALTRFTPIDNQLHDFLVPNTYLNDIMVADFQYATNFATPTAYAGGASGTWNKLDYKKLYIFDPLVTHFEFNVKKASKMSSYGLLSL